jgi:DNA-binding response OmpR family regulator
MSEVCPCCGSVVASDAMMDGVMIAEVVDRVGLVRQTAIIFMILWRAQGRTLTRTTIMDCMEQVMRGVEVSETMLNKAVSRLNREMKAAGHPVSVRPIYGIGYRIEVSAALWSWRTLPIRSFMCAEG